MDLPQAPAGNDALDQPTRARAFAFLAELRRPATIEEVAGHLGLHATGVRAHLARLEQDGLVERTVIRGDRGRPHYEWAVARGARPHGAPAEAYGDLARWLAGALAAGATSAAALERHGQAIGRSLAPADSRERPADGLLHVLTAMGFEPDCRADGATTTYELCNCPYRDAVHTAAQICALHEGITRGLLERIDANATLTAFVAKDPDRAGCLIQVDGMPTP